MSLSTLRVTWLISRLAWRRLGNRFARVARRAPNVSGRAATPRKSAPGRLLLGLMALLFAFQGVTLTTRLVEGAAHTVEQATPNAFFVSQNTFDYLHQVARQGACKPGETALRSDAHEVLGYEAGRRVDAQQQAARERVLVQEFDSHCADRFLATGVRSEFWPSRALWYGGSSPLGMPKALALAASLLALAIALQTVAGTGNDLTSIDARLEFLFAFPVRARALFLARLFAVALTSPALWVLQLPFFSVIFYCAGFGALALPLGAVSTLYVGLLSAALRVLVEATLPRLLSPVTVARCQAVLLVASYLSMVFAIGYSFRASRDGALESWLRLPDFALYGPATLPLLIAAGGTHAGVGALLALAFAGAGVTLAVLVAERSVRDGFVVSSNADQLKRGPAGEAPSARMSWLRGSAGKELKALVRDRQLRMQAFVMPVVLVLLQIWLNPSLLSSIGSSPRAIVVAAFGTSMFTLATGACALLATEGGALWMLYTVPVPLERVLASKLRVWIGVALFFAVAVMVGLWWRQPALLVPTLPYVPVLVLGIVIHAVIALGVGALGTDPLEAEPRRRVRPGAIYLFMLLAALFGYALFTPSWWSKLVELVLSALLAYALWQKLRDQLPYLLDPTEAPPPSLAVADGVLAAIGFFVLQSLFFLLFRGEGDPPMAVLPLAFAAAGASVSLLALSYFRHVRLPKLRETLGLRRPRRATTALAAVGSGALAGLGAAMLALMYQRLVVPQIPFLREASETPNLVTSVDASTRPWLVAMVVVAAPLFEEFIFRGILFAGFRRSLGAPIAALASAAVFALVHPPAAAPVVFVMALGATFVYHRFRWLGAPIATHFVYNATLVAAALRWN